MSDVVVSVVESTTDVTVSEQSVAVVITEATTQVSASTVGLQGIPGVGYSGITSTSNITIGSGLKTFTLVSGNAGAFVTGMRIRAIHSDTPTYYLEGTANYIGGGTLIITVDKYNGSGSHNLWNFSVAGEIGQTGATGASGVISVTAPITNTGSSSSAILGLDQTALSITRSQVSDFTSGTVASAGTAFYSTTSGTSLTISGSITNSQVSDFASGTVTNISGTVSQAQVSGLASTLSGYAALGTANTFTNYQTINNGTSLSTALSVATGATANKGLVITGVASQSANLFETITSAGTQVRINQVGNTTLNGNLTSNNNALFLPNTTATVPVKVQGLASQSANLTEWQDSAGATATLIASAGQIGTSQRVTVGSTTISTAGQLAVILGTDRVGLAVRATSGQTTNLTEWQNSGGTVIAKVDSAGLISTNQYFDVNQSFGGIAQQGTYRIRFGNSSVGIGATSPPSSGATGIVMFVSNLTSAPSSNPIGGGFLYVEAGALKYRGSSGTITILGAA
jgi:hypothetical protein